MTNQYNNLTQAWNKAARSWAIADGKTCTALTRRGTRCTRQVGKLVEIDGVKQLRCHQH